MKSESETHQSRETLTLGIVAHQALLSVGFPWQEYWSGLPFPSPGNLPETPALQADSLLLSHQGITVIKTKLFHVDRATIHPGPPSLVS